MGGTQWSYAESSANSHIKESICMNPLLNYVCHIHESVSEYQWDISMSLFEGEMVSTIILGFPVIQNHCNMDPLSYHKPCTNSIIVLVKEFYLMFPGMLAGLQTAFEDIPNMAYCFGLAGNPTLLQASRGTTKKTTSETLQSWFWISCLLLHVQVLPDQHLLEKRTNPLFCLLQLSYYTGPGYYMEQQMLSPQGTRWCAHAFMCMPSTFGEDLWDRAMVGKDLLSWLASHVPKTGGLIFNHHLMDIMVPQVDLLGRHGSKTTLKFLQACIKWNSLSTGSLSTGSLSTRWFYWLV
jgi:hypothetical protein